MDVETGAAPPVHVTLKRAGRTSLTLACGIAHPATVPAFIDLADAVLHVRVTRHRVFEMPSGTGPGDILTITDARVINPFKGAATAGRDGSVAVLQVGGAIDRGETVDQLHYNRLPPLSVGDDYVLFLKR